MLRYMRVHFVYKCNFYVSYSHGSAKKKQVSDLSMKKGVKEIVAVELAGFHEPPSPPRTVGRMVFSVNIEPDSVSPGFLMKPCSRSLLSSLLSESPPSGSVVTADGDVCVLCFQLATLLRKWGK